MNSHKLLLHGKSGNDIHILYKGNDSDPTIQPCRDTKDRKQFDQAYDHKHKVRDRIQLGHVIVFAISPSFLF